MTRCFMLTRYALMATVAVLSGCESEKAPPPAAPATTVTKQWQEFSSTVFGFKAKFPLNPPIPRNFNFDLKPDGVNQAESFSTELWDNEKKATGQVFSVTAARLSPGTSKKRQDEAAADFFQLKYHVPPGTKSSEPADVSWAGRPAKEIVSTAADASKAKFQRVVIRQLTTESALYVGAVWDAGGLTPAEVAKFFDGFQLMPGAGAK